MDRETFISFLWMMLIFSTISYSAYYICGRLVELYDFKVAYTRKMTHFVTFALPWTLQQAFDVADNMAVAVLAAVLVPAHLMIYLKPIRERVPVFETMFRSLDRPEDRPYTLWWISTQFVATYAVYVALYGVMIVRGVTPWMVMPLLVMAVGDGLAEPVGVTFGRHPYTTLALNGGGRHHRTLEGSACVFITAVIVVFGCYMWFTPWQLVAALAVIPLTATVMEAIAPHTWDSPLMLLAMGLQLIAISYV